MHLFLKHELNIYTIKRNEKIKFATIVTDPETEKISCSIKGGKYALLPKHLYSHIYKYIHACTHTYIHTLISHISFTMETHEELTGANCQLRLTAFKKKKKIDLKTNYS